MQLHAVLRVFAEDRLHRHAVRRNLEVHAEYIKIVEAGTGARSCKRQPDCSSDSSARPRSSAFCRTRECPSEPNCRRPPNTPDGTIRLSQADDRTTLPIASIVYSVDAGNLGSDGQSRVRQKAGDGRVELSLERSARQLTAARVAGYCFDNFYVFRVNFDVPTNRVTVQTIFGDSMTDGMELHAYNSSGIRIMRCRMEGWNDATVRNGCRRAAALHRSGNLFRRGVRTHGLGQELRRRGTW